MDSQRHHETLYESPIFKPAQQGPDKAGAFLLTDPAVDIMPQGPLMQAQGGSLLSMIDEALLLQDINMNMDEAV
ncbi:MAG: hypothetical protein KC475_05330 [Cyanobacteria bacterium HKST-UBA03]|nr:hypothetical protein [Cyanobacteria bacterium HKST-UBA03]